MEEERFKLPPLAHLGWAFLLAWVFCVFYTSAAGSINDGPAAEGAVSMGQMIFYGTMPLASSVATLVAIVIAEPRIGAPTSHRPLFVVAPLLTAASTPLMFVTLGDPAADALLFAAGSLATGVGSALLWVMWGEYYAVIPRDEAERLAPLSAVLGAGLVIIVSATAGWVPIALATLFPLFSGLCLRQAWTSDCARAEGALSRAARRAGQGAQHPLAGLGRTGFGIMAVFSIVSVAGMLSNERSDGAVLQGILVFSALMMALVALAAVSGPRRISLPFLYRWMCPILVAGFCAVILFGQAGAVIALAASLGGRFTFCLIAQIYFASYAASGRATPAQSASIGWLFVHLGDLVGYTAFLLLAPLLGSLADGATWICTVCIVALVTVTMFVLNDRNSFHRPLPVAAGDERPAQDAASRVLSAVAEGGADDRPAAGAQAASGACSEGADAQVEAEARAEAEAALRGNVDAESADQSEPGPSPDNALAGTVAALAAEHKLTPRETEVFALLAQGRSIPYIRDELIISRETAATHAKHIYAKLGVHSRQELIDLVRQ